MIAIIDYGVGNLFSLTSSLAAIGAEAVVTGDRRIIEKADKIILPGVGAFGDAADKLRESGLYDVIKRESEKGKPILGICLGMQLLFERGFEYGEHAGLGIISGEIRPISEVIPKELKIPHMGWNELNFGESKHPLFSYIKESDHVYFVHSYQAVTSDENIIAYTEYGAPITAAVARDNVMGCQFHPEKSGKIGLSILRAFSELEVQK